MFAIHWFMHYEHLGTEAVFNIEPIEAADREAAIDIAMMRWDASAAILHATAIELYEGEPAEAIWRYPAAETMPVEKNSLLMW